MKHKHSKKDKTSKTDLPSTQVAAALKQQVEQGSLFNRGIEERDPLRHSELSGIPKLASIPHSAEVIAVIAALLQPQQCKSADPTPALSDALVLLAKSTELTNQLEKLGSVEAFAGTTNHEGLARYVLRHSRQATFLLLDDSKDAKGGKSTGTGERQTAPPQDTAKDFLRKNLNLEGKDPERSRWKSTRMVRDNIGRFIVWNVTVINIRRAKQAAERKGSSGTQTAWTWTDPDAETKKRWEDWTDEASGGWNISGSFLDDFMDWFRDKKRAGIKVKEILPRTRKQVERFVKVNW